VQSPSWQNHLLRELEQGGFRMSILPGGRRLRLLADIQIPFAMAYLLLIQVVVYVIGFYKQVLIIHEKMGLLGFFLVAQLYTVFL
jgi:hypothetical protein